MASGNKQKSATETHELALFQFIITELDLATTFCQMSLSALDAARAARNAENARKAYQSAAHFRDKAHHLSEDMNAEIDERVEKLKPLIAKLP